MLSKERYMGIDYLRVFFSICVVAVHLGFISPSRIFNKDLYMSHSFTLSDFINFYVLLLAVPVFFITSNYLFSRKPVERKECYKLIKRIGKLAIFWTVLYLMFVHEGWQIIGCLPKTSLDLVLFVISGGGTIYWFFVSLLGLTIITHFLKSIRTSYIAIYFVITTLLVFSLPLLSMMTGRYMLCVHWNPLNFFPYPFAAILVSRLVDLKLNNQKLIYLMISWFLLCFLMIILDWEAYIHAGFFEVNFDTYAIPSYSRPSLIVISMAVMFLSIKIKPKYNVIIDFLSRYSLGLYCIHIFLAPLAIYLSHGNIIISLPITVAASYLVAVVMSHLLGRDLIRSR